MDLAWTPDGRMLIATKPGRLRVASGGQLLAAPAVDLTTQTCRNFERGMLGVAVDPAFTTNHFVYLLWTHRTGSTCPTLSLSSPENRISRFTLGADSKVVPGSQKVIADHIPSFTGTHNAGDIAFGTDGLIYATLGDNGCQMDVPANCQGANQNSRRLDVLVGKLIRIKKDGTIPASNPYATVAGHRRCSAPAGVPAGTGPCAETYASGFRNPFRFAIQPGTGKPWVNDVGENTWEEVDRVAAGADYGWPTCEGAHPQGGTAAEPCPDPLLSDPLLEYDHSAGCRSITGAAFVPVGTFGSHAGSYLYSDYICRAIFERRPDGTVSTFASGLASGGPVSMAFGPGAATGAQALYYVTQANGGEVHRVAPTGS
jgi:glucose/arabinose dehydrogenase